MEREEGESWEEKGWARCWSGRAEERAELAPAVEYESVGENWGDDCRPLNLVARAQPPRPLSPLGNSITASPCHPCVEQSAASIQAAHTSRQHSTTVE